MSVAVSLLHSHTDRTAHPIKKYSFADPPLEFNEFPSKTPRDILGHGWLRFEGQGALRLSTKDRWCFLFTDLLVPTKSRETFSDCYPPPHYAHFTIDNERIISLRDCEIQNQSGAKFALLSQYPKPHKIKLCANSGKSKELWVRSIEDLIVNLASTEEKSDLSLDPYSRRHVIRPGTHFAAAASGDRDAVQVFLQVDKIDINDVDGDARTMLHHSVANDSLDVTQLLVRCGANVNQRDKDSERPIHVAARQGHATCLEELLRQGAFPNARSAAGHTPLHLAGNKKTASLLVYHGAQTEIEGSNGESGPGFDLYEAMTQWEGRIDPLMAEGSNTSDIGGIENFSILKSKSSWELDSSSRECTLCGSPFACCGNRRHHCRLCGKLVCGSCSTKELALQPEPLSELLPYRTCDSCFNSTLSRQKLLTKRSVNRRDNDLKAKIKKRMEVERIRLKYGVTDSKYGSIDK